MNKRLIGPIIGKVTDTTARILVEYQTDTDVEVKITAQNDKKLQQQLVPGCKPTIFQFTNLQPNTKYYVSVTPYDGVLQSSFKTMKKDTDEKNLRICWISCNDIRKGEKFQKQNSLWSKLYQEVQNNSYDLIIHMGDQVYLDSDYWNGNLDNCYSYCKAQYFDKFPQSDWTKYEAQLKELIRNEYRRTWNYEPTAKVLANCPNMMFLDDHEVRNSWGFRSEDWDPNTKKCDYYYGQLARQVYYEYQRQLWDDQLDINNISKVDKEYTWFSIGKVGFFFIELRGHRTWHRIQKYDSSLQLGKQQYDDFKDVVTNKFKDMENLIVISQSAIVFLSEQINDLVGLKLDDVKEQWVNYEDRQIEFIKFLYDWKKSNKKREVTIVAGDLHTGGHTDIYYNGNQAFKQLTSSAIMNEIDSKIGSLALQLAAGLSSKLKKYVTFDHHDWTLKPNYAVTHIYNNDTGNMVDCWQVIGPSKDEIGQFTVTPIINNYTFKKEKSDGCCQIF